MLKIAIVGGGAAGFFSAIHAAASGAQVVIFEKGSKVLTKVKISGGGRCNVTHAAFENSHLVKQYPRGGRFLKKSFQQFSVKDTIAWYEDRGVQLKTEEDGRIFPTSDLSQSIIDALRREVNKQGVEVKLSSPVTNIERMEGGFCIKTKNEHFLADRVIITTGGHPKKEGFRMLENLNHPIVSPIPSLFTFNSPKSDLRKLAGISLPNAHLKLEGSKLAYQGPLLITHWGVSGPAVLKLSAFGARWLNEKEYKANVQIRWVADLTENEIRQHLLEYKNGHPKKKIKTNPLFELPKRLWEHLVDSAEITAEKMWMDINKKQINKLEQQIFCYILHVDGKTTFKEEFVTAGGVDLKSVNPQTMESKLVPHIYFAGEVLDIDGITGGFNFQAAWTTGYIAGVSASKKEFK
ncbi:NAD(P)/FAD-dependent oxidoreductase [Echinicola jeungdonensis]|uniref:NAD(P)/FAD-dependent oxidoreductase n=1 Tax=Echinicola jeungdonensis TaxID=709343 RepID=A0ABV5J711_9BACT|nr:NAD(P)/FAD-dependent oxidoreductase [Echinicola jeungdonensis]MDN3670749.1 NAD(P)/FAD-dependent oxidoreductase [Echinicola jeungdonensis]